MVKAPTPMHAAGYSSERRGPLPDLNVTGNTDKFDWRPTDADLRCLAALLWIVGEIDLSLDDRRQVEILAAEITSSLRHRPDRSIGCVFETAQRRIDQLRSLTKSSGA